ncbi:MAG: SDR family NAD(P)-dependent oxidoreductase, partial [Phascolarctobacterium sp.]|nr:SDR family NAD(P)-dependent oxidoreductase [Phascolarctobacterium sp.]
MRFEGKVALVTGASRGIGRAIALALAAEGADVAVNYAGSEAAAKEVAAEIEAMGRKAFVIQADIASTEASTAMVDAVVKEFGRVDVLVNNAGITRDGLLMRMKEEDWDAVITTNLKGVF